MGGYSEVLLFWECFVCQVSGRSFDLILFILDPSIAFN
jgi:hypothetical protein